MRDCQCQEERIDDKADDKEKILNRCRMAVNRGVGLGALFLFFVLAVALLPLLRHFTMSSLEGYQTEYADAGLGGNGQGPMGPGQSVRVTPDVNVDPTLGFDSRTSDMALPCNVDANGQVCPEGTFCDGPTRSCVRINAATIQNEVVGYFS
jgi:hypothetical protein